MSLSHDMDVDVHIFKKLPDCFSKVVETFSFQSTVDKRPPCSRSSPTPGTSSVCSFGCSNRNMVVLPCILCIPDG